jgi:shikimate dehydrogenase
MDPLATPTPLRFRLLGLGISYSASPAMMGAAFARLGLPHTYELADVTEAALPEVVAALREPGAGGANVTVPHKGAVAALMDELSPDAERTGAVNCVVRDDDRLVGHNTDLPALTDELRQLRPDGIAHAVVLGAGGAARAVITALQDLGATRITGLTRRDGSWDRMADELATADLVVNATPVGTGGVATPVPAALHRPDLAVYDLVYRPSPTLLVTEGRPGRRRDAARPGVAEPRAVARSTGAHRRHA